MSETSPPQGALPLVLIIEDEPQMLRFLKPALEAHGFRVFAAATGAEGLRQAATRGPDLVLLDLGLPDMDGLEVTAKLREWSQVPILVLSARGQERDKVAVLDAGADDYVTKPFGMGELLARIRVAMRHSIQSASPGDASEVVVGPLRVDLEKRRVFLLDEEIHLTPLEYRLLAALLKSPGRVFTHSQLLREVWGPGYTHQHHYLRVYMTQLRHKLEEDPSRPEILITEPGVGYRLRDP